MATYGLWWTREDGQFAIHAGDYASSEAAEAAIPEALADLIAKQQRMDDESCMPSRADEIRAGRFVIEEQDPEVTQ
jgi:hypothetical protein